MNADAKRRSYISFFNLNINPTLFVFSFKILCRLVMMKTMTKIQKMQVMAMVNP